MTLLDGGCLAGRIIPDDYRTLPRFLIEQLSRCPGGYHTALEFGCGPALYTALSFAPSVRRLHVADYLAGNRAEVRRWLASVRPVGPGLTEAGYSNRSMRSGISGRSRLPAAAAAAGVRPVHAGRPRGADPGLGR